MAKPVLHSYFRSSCSWRVRIVLALKNIDYDYVAVNLIKDGGQQKSEDYSTKNPMQQVPTLEVNGQNLTQSVAIMEYLEEVYPKPALLPNEPFERAKVRQVCEIICSGIQPVQNLSVLQKVGAEGKMEWGRYWIDKGFKALETVLKQTSGTYCVGDNVTLADACIVPQLYNANRFSVNMELYPVITRVCDNLMKLDAFKNSHPSKMPDCPEDLR